MEEGAISLLNLRPVDTATRIRANKCLSPAEALTQASFVFVGLGVALPWSSLRAGISFFVARFNAQFYVYLFLAYNISQLLVLTLQQWDKRVDIRLGTSVTYPFRLCVSLALLAGCQVALPYAMGGQAMALGVALALGFFDGVAFGSASQLFTHVQRGSAAAYFLGSSLASVAAIGFSYASGFSALPPARAGAGAPPELFYFYLSCSGASASALLAVAALLCSAEGRRYLEELDDAFLDSAPSSPRAVAKRRASTARSGSPTMELELALLSGGGGGGGGAGALAPPFFYPAVEPPRPSPSAAALLWRAAPLHASIFVTWMATVAGDSFLGYVPSASDTRAAASASFRLLLVYSSLGGDLLGKNVMVFCGMRRARGGGGGSGGGGGGGGGGADDGGGSLNAAAEHFQGRMRLRGEDGARAAAKAAPLVPCISSPRLLLALCLARAALLLPLLLGYSLQQLFGPPRGALLPGFFYSDAAALAAQFLFDASGAFLSSLTYSVLAAAFEDLPEHRTLASTQLGLCLTAGSFAGVGIAAGLSRLLPSM
jgi:hypothetical protein